MRSKGKKGDGLSLHGVGQVSGVFTRGGEERRGTGGREKSNKGTGEDGSYKTAPCSRLSRLDRIGLFRAFVRGFIFSRDELLHQSALLSRSFGQNE